MPTTGDRWHWLAALPLAAAMLGSACGGKSTGSSPEADGGGADGGAVAQGEGGSGAEAGSDEGGEATTGNVVPLVVNAGPPGVESVDVAFITVTVCIPGTTTCKTIDSVSVDTGSSGLRLISTALGGLALPQVDATTGDSLAECLQFEDGYTWGSVRTADVKIGGELAAKIPVHLVGDPAFPTVPSDCSAGLDGEDTVARFGGNGLIGINQIIPDCGAYCADTQEVGTAGYYSCNGGTCTAVAVAQADQISNPIASFSQDNNGAILAFPTVPAAGAPSLTGSLTFGIGTQANNALGSATVQTLDGEGFLTTVFNGQTLTQSYVDSGTNTYAFNDSAIAGCTGDWDGFDCPASPLALSAQNKGLNGALTTVSFTVESTETLFDNASYTAFDDLATPGSDGSFAWGFPFFIGRSVFVGLSGKSTPGGKGPFVAY